MSATVTEKHRELAWQRIKDACSLLPPRAAHDLAVDISQAIADAEARGREAGIREAADDAYACCVGRILALLAPEKEKP